MNNEPLNLPALRVLLVIAVGLSFFYNLHAVPLFDLDEGAFSEATREMFERGDFISPYLNGEPRYDKPVLIHWLQAASVAVFGVGEFAFRLPSALAATLWVWAVFAFARHVATRESAYLAAIVTASALMVSVMAKAATADALLNLFIAAATFCSYLFWRERRPRYVYFAFALMALGFLTKGPVAVAVPFVVSLIFFAVKGEWRLWLKTVFNPLGISLFLAIALPWYVAQYLKEGDAFIQGFFFRHNLGRFQGGMEGHTGDLWYYLPVLLIAVLPFTVVLFKAVGEGKRWWRDELWLFVLIWFGFVFVFFSLSATKLPHYLLYGLSGVFVILGIVMQEMRSRVWVFVPQILFFLLLACLPEFIERTLPDIDDEFARAALARADEFFTADYRWFFIGAIAFSVLLMYPWRLRLEYKLTASALVLVFAVSHYFLPLLGFVHQAPLREAALLARERGYDVVMWKMTMPSFSVYRGAVTPKRDPEPGEVIVTRTHHLNDLPGYELFYEEGGIALARVLE